MLTEHLHRSESEREQLMELMFEKVECAAFYIAASPYLSMYSLGRQTGVVVEMGNSCVQSAANYDSTLYSTSWGINMESNVLRMVTWSTPSPMCKAT